MTKPPERIWAWDDENCTPNNPHNKFTTEYIRADLVTQCTPDPAVQALVDAARAYIHIATCDTQEQIDAESNLRATLAAFNKTD